MEKEYIIMPPKYFEGESVEILDHRDNYQQGKISRVRTRYDHQNISYHVYSIKVFGWKREIHIAENKIIGRI